MAMVVVKLKPEKMVQSWNILKNGVASWASAFVPLCLPSRLHRPKSVSAINWLFFFSDQYLSNLISSGICTHEDSNTCSNLVVGVT